MEGFCILVLGFSVAICILTAGFYRTKLSRVEEKVQKNHEKMCLLIYEHIALFIKDYTTGLKIFCDHYDGGTYNITVKNISAGLLIVEVQVVQSHLGGREGVITLSGRAPSDRGRGRKFYSADADGVIKVVTSLKIILGKYAK